MGLTNRRSEAAVPGAVISATADEQLAFYKRTYAHLAGAILMFIGVSYLVVTSSIGEGLFEFAMGGSFNWAIFLVAFMAVGWVADKWARSDTSQSLQYLGLGLYVIAEALIFTPLLYIAAIELQQPEAIKMAAIITLLLFAGLTGTVFLMKKDFSFMKGALAIGSFAAMGLIVAGMIFGFHLGLVFSGFMVVLAGGYVLYYTSQVRLYYRPTQHVAAALTLFSAIALMFYYILMIVLELMND